LLRAEREAKKQKRLVLPRQKVGWIGGIPFIKRDLKGQDPGDML
jgi:hypothetical protein